MVLAPRPEHPGPAQSYVEVYVDPGALARDRCLNLGLLEKPNGEVFCSHILTAPCMEVLSNAVIDHVKCCLYTTQGEYMHPQDKQISQAIHHQVLF